jgi:hypothetical protein
VQVAYAIGVARPMNVTVYTEGTGKISDEQIVELVNAHFDLRPKGIIRMLDLLRPIYRKTAAYGHFGRDEPNSRGRRRTRPMRCVPPRGCGCRPAQSQKRLTTRLAAKRADRGLSSSLRSLWSRFAS